MLAVLMFVCAAVALNWSYNNRWGTPDSEMVSAEDEAMMSANAEFADNLVNTGSEYFAEARLTRQVSRDEALELLQTAATSENASQETIDSAMSAISAMAACTMQEAQIENLLIAKDFADCVVYLSSQDCTVVVPSGADGLTETQVAQITDAVLSNTELTAAAINVIEVRN